MGLLAALDVAISDVEVLGVEVLGVEVLGEQAARPKSIAALDTVINRERIIFSFIVALYLPLNLCHDKGNRARYAVAMTDTAPPTTPQMTPEQIDQALAAGIITPEQAGAMRRLLTEHNTPSDNNAAVIGDEDNMRFVRSFSDVFIGIGLALLALGLSFVGAISGGGSRYLLAAAVMAFLAAYFGRKTRQHLPTLITALAFLFFTHKGLGGIIGGGSGIIAALITIGAMLGYYLFIRLPFCIALIAISVIFLVFAVARQLVPDMMIGQQSWLFVMCGFATLIVAVIYDMKDTQRLTRFADNAFWLHLTAAPLIVHGLAFRAAMAKTDMVMGVLPVPDVGRGDAVILLLIVGAIGLLGLALNRRALLVSSLGYAVFAIVFLMSGSGINFGMSLALAFVLLGAAIIALGVAWHPMRNQLIKILPKWKIFPPAYNRA